MDLSALAGRSVYMGWVHFHNAWWAWFNNEWLGYMNDSEWNGQFTRTAQIQWYGEVASNNGRHGRTWATGSFHRMPPPQE